jgi:hypothetical protein
MSENSQQYTQKPQRNCTFMNAAFVHSEFPISVLSVIVLIAYYIISNPLCMASLLLPLSASDVVSTVYAAAAYFMSFKSWHITLDSVYGEAVFLCRFKITVFTDFIINYARLSSQIPD